MENENKERSDYAFLEIEKVERHFADLNIKLLSGKHIFIEDYNAFSLLEDYFDQFKSFYERLYRLDLNRDTFDRVTYYYLNFFNVGKGPLYESSRNRPLTELQTITGLMVLDMYYSRYFENPKVIFWEDIRREIEEGDHKQDYQRILFGDLRDSYTESEWQIVDRKFRQTILSFHELGWVKKQFAQGEEISFEITPCIHRLVQLYSPELENFNEFALRIKSYNKE